MTRKEFVAGKSIDQILNMPLKELEKLTTSQLRELVGRGVSAGNKRIRRFEKKMGSLPQVGQKDRTTYNEMKFSTVGKDRQGLMEEFKRIKQYMRAETSSLRGYKNVQKKAIRSLQSSAGIDLTKTNYDRFWKAYERLKELHPEIADSNYKYGILQEMASRVEGKKRFSIDKLIRDMESKITEIYEEQQGVANGDGTSGFFEI